MDDSTKRLQRTAAEEIIAKQMRTETPTLHFLVPETLSKKIRSYVLIEDDMNFVLKAIESLLSRLREPNHVVSVVDTSLWFSIVTVYCKPFTKSDGSFSSLESILFNENANYLSIHDKLISLRNKYIAHRDNSEHENSRTFLKVKQLVNNKLEVNHHTESNFKTVPSINDIEGYKEVAHYILQYVAYKISQEGEKIWRKISTEDTEVLLQLIVNENYGSLIE